MVLKAKHFCEYFNPHRDAQYLADFNGFNPRVGWITSVLKCQILVFLKFVVGVRPWAILTYDYAFSQSSTVVAFYRACLYRFQALGCDSLDSTGSFQDEDWGHYDQENSDPGMRVTQITQQHLGHFWRKKRFNPKTAGDGIPLMTSPHLVLGFQWSCRLCCLIQI